MKQIFVLLLVSITSSVSWAGKETGGGDPDAIQFLMSADEVVAWLKTSPLLPVIDRDSYQKQVDTLRQSLDDPNQSPLLVFQDEPVTCLDNSKLACTKNGKVTVSRPDWRGLTLDKQFETVSLEIFVLMNLMTDRYTMAETIGQHAADIEILANHSGTIVIDGITGVSASDISPEGVIRILGGTAGSSACSKSEPCNSCGKAATCSTAPFCACNEAQIGPNTILTIKFTSTVCGNPAIASNSPSGGLLQSLTSGGACGETQIVSVRWSDICQYVLNADKGCSAPFATGTLRVGISTDGTTLADSASLPVSIAGQSLNVVDDCSAPGICNFAVYPRESGAFVEGLTVAVDFPVGSAQAVRVFASSVGFDKTTPDEADSFIDMEITPDNVANNWIGGLTDSTTYYFRIAIVDIANNIYGFISDKNINDPDYGKCHAGTPATVDTDLKDDCQYRAVPSSVKGSLVPKARTLGYEP